uniref:Uncharacterized protein n=1 Tax=Zea mays TaxID=4577 RepID=Q36273_MAIZE|nr:unknown protein [Zea mays]
MEWLSLLSQVLEGSTYLLVPLHYRSGLTFPRVRSREGA